MYGSFMENHVDYGQAEGADREMVLASHRLVV